MTRAVELTLGGTLRLLFNEAPSITAFFTVNFENFTLTARGDKMAYTLPADHTVRMKVTYVDANGNEATIDNDPVWESSNPEIASVTADTADAFQAEIIPGTTVGQVQITAKVDADLGEGERELVTLCDITVVGGEAVAGTIEPVGPPEPQA